MPPRSQQTTVVTATGGKQFRNPANKKDLLVDESPEGQEMADRSKVSNKAKDSGKPSTGKATVRIEKKPQYKNPEAAAARQQKRRALERAVYEEYNADILGAIRESGRQNDLPSYVTDTNVLSSTSKYIPFARMELAAGSLGATRMSHNVKVFLSMKYAKLLNYYVKLVLIAKKRNPKMKTITVKDVIEALSIQQAKRSTCSLLSNVIDLDPQTTDKLTDVEREDEEDEDLNQVDGNEDNNE